MGVEDVDALARARDDECAKTAAASPHARRQNAFNRPARQGRTAIIDDHARADDKALRRVVGTVALLNLAYFGVEFAVALRIGSVSLFADSVDFLEAARSDEHMSELQSLMRISYAVFCLQKKNQLLT